MLTSCAQAPVVRTQTVEVRVPSYVALPAELTAPAPWPEAPAVWTNASLAQYVLDLQSALKQDVDKLDKIHALQPEPAHAVSTENP